ncbi:hypothetical protein NPIL_226021 [Nephila pilipes]|uniref:DUF5641 domain-containing protein n=1 Tax=Nephila pilipes TaxID=299642 RepID=A0A8X6UP26_NEPPI|nr:hypothetical protein NPIL_226021 [Nephila pilipes]
MIRFCRNSRLVKACRVTDVLTPDELKEAEMKIMLIDQTTSFVYGRVTEIFPGKDGITRLEKVKTTCGEKLRPVQRLYSLEISFFRTSSTSSIEKFKKTFSMYGKKSKK